MFNIYVNVLQAAALPVAFLTPFAAAAAIMLGRKHRV